jgi:CspA family cold shock protein
MAKGKVKWYDSVKGYGFIQADSGEELFVHRTGLLKAYDGLQENDVVEFESKQGDKGLVAFNVQQAE